MLFFHFRADENAENFLMSKEIYAKLFLVVVVFYLEGFWHFCSGFIFLHILKVYFLSKTSFRIPLNFSPSKISQFRGPQTKPFVQGSSLMTLWGVIKLYLIKLFFFVCPSPTDFYDFISTCRELCDWVAVLLFFPISKGESGKKARAERVEFGIRKPAILERSFLSNLPPNVWGCLRGKVGIKTKASRPQTYTLAQSFCVGP